LGTIGAVLAMPMKRFERPLVGYLSRDEVEALLNAPNPVPGAANAIASCLPRFTTQAPECLS
jgi:hypothetical protein